MKIKIEVDLTPTELRTFLGLPDVASLQDDMIEYVRDKVVQSTENFDPAHFVKDNIQSTKAWKRLMSVVSSIGLEEEEVLEKAAPKKTAATRSTARKKPAAKKSG